MEIVARAATFKKTSGWVGDGEDSKKKIVDQQWVSTTKRGCEEKGRALM